MQRIWDFLIIITAVLLFVSLFTSGWVAVGFAAAAAITAAVTMIFRNTKK